MPFALDPMERISKSFKLPKPCRYGDPELSLYGSL